ncbi:MAG: alpha-amylase family glycosyl hydrolase [Actinomycetota bacterium]|nr:alpha-amylase family glycosyl hydrolase [Actinomycetota bacterium]
MQALTHLRATPLAQRLTGSDWWRGAVGYEIYVRSFQDSNGDGVGDLGGITARLPYLAALGVDVVWLTPFFPSPGLDHGYDVADYLDVDPQLGTMADWHELAATAKQLGLRLFVDIVPNHTSDRHEWFQQAVADPTGPFRDYYLWADPASDGGVPNNWVSHFGGPAWSLDPGGSGQYYCHLFLPEQPDLNWANPAVMAEFAQILDFWCQAGADGFRIDVAHGLTKDPELRDNPVLRPVQPGMHPIDTFASFEHVYDLHRHETAVLFRQWRQAVAAHDAVLVGEMDTRNVHRFAEYVQDQQALHAGFVLQLGLSEWAPAAILHTMLEYQAEAGGGTAWEVSNHDQARAVSRYGGGELGLRRALALTTLMAAFDGMLFLYQGEELGLPDAVVVGHAEDPMSSRNGEGMWSRDVARGPMPWTQGAGGGFTTAEVAWLHTQPVAAQLTAAAQTDSAGSTWQRYRALTHLRKQHPELWQAPFELVEHGPSHVVIARGPLRVIANLGTAPLAVPATPLLGATAPSAAAAEVLFTSWPDAFALDADVVRVAAETTVVIRRAAG